MTNEAQAAHEAMKEIIKPFNLFNCLHEFDLWLNDATLDELKVMRKMCDCSEGMLHLIVIESHIKHITK